MKELNEEEYIKLISQMRELNEKRHEIFKKFKKINVDVKIKIMKTPSIYHDLFGNDLDKAEQSIKI
jgi:hypothetical protein